MNTNSKRLGIYLVTMLILTAVATTLRTIACVTELDFASGFFNNKSLITVANALITLTVLGMFSYTVVAKKVTLRPSFSTGATYVPTGILGVALAFIGIKTFSYVLAINNYRLYDFKASSLRELIAELLTPIAISTTIGIIAGVLAFVSIAHHFFNAYLTEEQSVIRAYFAIASIAFVGFYAILVYTDSSITVNDSAKSIRQITFLLVATFLLYEARISLGRSRWRLYTSFGLVAAAMTAYASIPAIITYFAKGVIISSSGYKSLASLEEYLLLLAFFIFIVSRLCLTATLKEEKENELVEAFAAVARERENKVSGSMEQYSKEFSTKQLSFFELENIPDENVTEEIEGETSPDPKEQKEITISDDVIYESIFGKMPEPPMAESPVEEEAVTDDGRDADQIAESLLNIIEEADKTDDI